VDCNDGVLCTDDTCNEGTDSCDNVANNANCDNATACDGVETCDATLDCQAGTAPDCGDTIDCTIDACAEDALQPEGYSCSNTEDNTACPQDQYCCADCPPDPGCIPVPQCDTDADCDDLDACNGVETCVDQGSSGKVCVFGSPVVCDDGVSCTTGACNPGDGSCTFTPQDSLCDNGLFCDGAETCDLTLGCQAGVTETCDDSIACTDDACIEGFGCFNSANNTLCDNGLTCDGAETCSVPDGGCIDGVTPDCDDGIACTADSCDEAVPGGCKNVADNTLCPCGEVCDPAADPVDGCSNTCVVSECEGTVYACGDCTDNDGDCAIDAGVDLECFGPCDDNEAGYKGLISGQNDNCDVDCYFDDNNGNGDDTCKWSFACDPLEPQTPPLSSCSYEDTDPADGWGDANVTGSPSQWTTCQELFENQTSECWNENLTDETNNVCGKYVPNGCDCFGCCEVQKNACQTDADCPGTGSPVCDTFTNQCVYTIYLGSQNGGNPNDPGSCNYDELENPANCHECTQVEACLNECESETCELCFGQTELPPECTEQSCDEGVQLCGQAGQDPCPVGATCLTGCCIFG
jgi:hypothetical protein